MLAICSGRRLRGDSGVANGSLDDVERKLPQGHRGQESKDDQPEETGIVLEWDVEKVVELAVDDQAQRMSNARLEKNLPDWAVVG